MQMGSPIGLAVKLKQHLQIRRVISSSPYYYSQNQRWVPSQFLNKHLSSSSSSSSSDGREMTVSSSEGGNNSNRPHLFPSLYELFPPALGNALLQASENLNRVFRNLAPNRLMGRVKEQEECYKLRFDLPGLGKDDVKITVEDRILRIRGEHKQEEDEEEGWARSYGYYDTCLVLPEDAKAEEVKAEMKDGVLNITIPRTDEGDKKKDVKQVQIL